MKFEIENRTKYRTRHLRSFVTRAYAVATQFAGERAVNFERFRTTTKVRFAVSNRRGSTGTTGHAYLNYGFAHIGLGDMVDPHYLAYTIAHEFAHCFGMRHSEMSGGALMNESDRAMLERFYPWATSLPLEKVPPKAKRSAADKRATLAARLERWEAKQRRAERAVKRLRAKLREFDRRQERKAALPPTHNRESP